MPPTAPPKSATATVEVNISRKGIETLIHRGSSCPRKRLKGVCPCFLTVLKSVATTNFTGGCTPRPDPNIFRVSVKKCKAASLVRNLTTMLDMKGRYFTAAPSSPDEKSQAATGWELVYTDMIKLSLSSVPFHRTLT